MKGLNSPWGSIWSIATATGWTVDYIMWSVAWINIRMMLTDAPRMVYQKSGDTSSNTLETADAMDAFFNK